MRRVLIFLVLFAGSVLAQPCIDYLKEGDRYLQGGICSYPNCFPAAEYYMKAADCYKSTGETATAMKYYGDAAGYFVNAAENLLVQGGDNLLRGRCYEYAADSYLEVNDNAKAAQYYADALTVYRDYGFIDDFNRLSEKLAPQQPVSTPTGYAAQPNNWGLAAIAGVFVLGVLIVLVFFKKRDAPPKFAPRPANREIITAKESGPASGQQTFESAFGEPEARGPAATSAGADSAKDKMRKKIRERYNLE